MSEEVIKLPAPTIELVCTTPAGRLMDAWVAHTLFGWRWQKSNTHKFCALQPPESDGWVRTNYSPVNSTELVEWLPDHDTPFRDWDRCGWYQDPNTSRKADVHGLPFYSQNWTWVEKIVEQYEKMRPATFLDIRPMTVSREVVISRPLWTDNKELKTILAQHKDIMVTGTTMIVGAETIPLALCRTVLLALLPAVPK